MSKLVDIEKIKAEILQRIKEEKAKTVNGTVRYYGLRQQVYSSILSFLETLPEEKQEDCPKIKGYVVRDSDSGFRSVIVTDSYTWEEQNALAEAFPDLELGDSVEVELTVNKIL